MKVKFRIFLSTCQQDCRRLFKGVSSKALLEYELNVNYVFSAPLHAIFLMPYTLNATLLRYIVPLEYIFQPDAQNLEEGAHHCEDHPDVDHLDVSRAWK